MNNKKVLILSCGTGGGHNSAALAIKENLNGHGVRADFVEYLDIINKRLRNGVNKLYLKSTKMNGKVFKQAYRLGELYCKTNLVSPIYGLNRLNRKKLYKYIKDNGYDYIVTTHLFAALSLTAIKKEHPIHFIAIATDYVCIPFWEEVDPDYFVIPSHELKEDFINKGILQEKLLPYGIPVSHDFRNEESKEEAKERLNLENEKRYVLVLTGSMGFGNVTDMIKHLLEEIKGVIFIVSCGNNNKMRQNINKEFGDRVITLPYSNDLSTYIRASEAVLTKPGGLTSTEIATVRKPFIHTMPIPGCENYNADFFDKRKMSIKCDTLDDVVKNTKLLLENKELQNEMIENQRKYIHKDTCENIAKIILK